MTHPIFRKEIFVETAFEIRFQAMLRSALYNRSWHLIVADPGAGKTMGVCQWVRTVGSPRILAVVAPKNNPDESALGNQLWSSLGLKLTGHWSNRKPKLMGHLHESGTECLIVDDAHDLEFQHLLFIKELTDQGRLQYDHPLGLCLVAAGRGNTIPLKEILYQPDPTWLQFRRRLDPLEPFCKIPGHTSEEVREILAALETVYREALPQLNLRKFSGSIYSWLTQTVLDPTNSGRVTMDNLMKLVTTALAWSYEAKATDVLVEKLEEVAQLLVLRRDTLWIIDGAGPSTEAPPSESTGQEQASGTGTEQVPSPDGSHEKSTSVPTEQVDQARSRQSEPATVQSDKKQPAKPTKCTFSGVVPIELQRFLDSGVALVECPDCASTRTLEPHRGVLRFKSHDKRKTNTPNIEPRWVWRGTLWEAVGG
jgi:hypothetical protein